MITYKDIDTAITTLIKNNFSVGVKSQNIKKGFERPSFSTRFDNVKKSSVNLEQEHRDLTCRIYYFPNSRYKNEVELLEVREKLESVFDMKLKVGDRELNINETECVETDGILQFYFDLSFEQGKDVPDSKIMENLIIKD